MSWKTKANNNVYTKLKKSFRCLYNPDHAVRNLKFVVTKFGPPYMKLFLSTYNVLAILLIYPFFFKYDDFQRKYNAMIYGIRTKKFGLQTHVR